MRKKEKAKRLAQKPIDSAKDFLKYQEDKKRNQEERLLKMREAYRGKSIVMGGVALHAPPAVLRELGFDDDALEASSDRIIDIVDADTGLEGERLVKAAETLQVPMDWKEVQKAAAAEKRRLLNKTRGSANTRREAITERGVKPLEYDADGNLKPEIEDEISQYINC